MSNYWFFQANPDRYDIDGALQKLDTIHWNVPQYTGDVRAGDQVAIWRSGPDAGIVGGGTVLESPREMDSIPAETYFSRVSDVTEDNLRATRAPLRVRSIPFVPKHRVASSRELTRHQIVIAPMGTVFPIEPNQWEALVSLAPELGRLPEVEPPKAKEWVKPFSWEERRKSVYPLPGGYDQYLDSLQTILEHVAAVLPDGESLEDWIQETFGTTPTSSRFAVAFLERISLISARVSGVELTPEARYWLSTRDRGYLVALIHSRVRFFGELLSLVDGVAGVDGLLDKANDLYGMGWKSRAQIDRRRGWLESTGTIRIDEQGLWRRTEFGDSVVASLRVEPPRLDEHKKIPPDSGTRLDDGDKPSVRGRDDAAFQDALRLEKLLQDTSVRTSDHTAFEKAAADAFSFLGFQTTWLGGSGQTDVLLVADLAPDEAYRVIVDCKTTAREAVRDHQVDWVTLREHREQHEADYIVVMAPTFAGSRIVERANAADWRTLLLDVEAMGSLLRQHAQVPLDLASYRQLFEANTGQSAASQLAEIAEEVDHRFQLAAHICRLIVQHESREGALTARDLYWLLRELSDEIGPYSDGEIEESLTALASPAVGLLREKNGAYVSLGSLATAGRRLTLLARLIEAKD